MAPPVHNACPDALTLQRFLLGQVSGPAAEELEQHLAGCLRCGEAARTLPTEDALVEAMRRSGGSGAWPQQELVEAVMPLLKRLRPRDQTATLPPRGGPAGGDTPVHGPTEQLFDFLAPPQAPGEMGRLGPYRVLRPLGAGGMGVVFLAEDPRLKRHIALKVIRPGLVARADLRQRFLREAQAAAKVEHDNIVTIHHIDEVDGVPYLAMPLLRGETLEDRLRRGDGPLPPDEILRTGREIAEGLAAAHAQGLVHRDIKPGNIFLVSSGGASSEWLVAGEEAAALATSHSPLATPHSKVKILDFGLAQLVHGEDDGGAPEAGTIQGTPAYMAPEQARGEAGDARADLFSLGCVLYRMATGRPAFPGDDVLAVLMSVATEEPPPPCQLNPELPAPVADLIVRLLAKRPEDRPASAQDCALALRAVEQERADAARRRLVRRGLLASAAAVLLAVGLTVWLRPHGDGQPPPPPDPGEVAFDFNDPDQRLVVQRGGDEPQVLDLKDGRVRPLPPGDYVVRAETEKKDRRMWPDHFHVESGEATRVVLRLVGEVRRGHLGSVWSVAMSPNKGSLLALAGTVADRQVYLWDAATEEDVKPLDSAEGVHKGPVTAVAISPDGRYVLSGTGRAPRTDYAVRLWDLEGRAAVASFLGHKNAVKVIAFAADGKRFLSGGDDKTALLWDIPEHKILCTLAGHGNSVYGAAFSPDGRHALTGGRDGLVILWDAATGLQVKRLEGHKDAVRCVAFAPDGTSAASASWDGSLRVWDLKTDSAREIRASSSDQAKAGFNAVAYSPDGKRLLSGGVDGAVRLWDVATGRQVYCFQGHSGEVHGIAFAADGRRAVSGGADRTLRLWELPQ